ncbi:MAG: 4-hydroxy-tetrahydrodipicolinate synthase [Solirubrobacterales bacterium]
MGAPASLRGSIVPLVTPFREGEIDFAEFEAAVERQVSEGSHGIAITGTTGEPTSLAAAERVDLYRRAAQVAAGRIAVVAATGSPNQAETIELTRAAEASGVDAALVVCPAFVKPSQEGLARHFETVAGTTSLPLLIYNIPGRSGVGVTADTVERVAESASNLVGIKHASQDLDLLTDLILRLGEDFRVFCGLESFSYPFLSLGGAGLMSAVGNLMPARVAELCELVAAGDHDRALAVHRELFRINQAIFFDTNPGPLKTMLEATGQGSAEVRPPLAPLSSATRARVLEALATVDIAESSV